MRRAAYALGVALAAGPGCGSTSDSPAPTSSAGRGSGGEAFAGASAQGNSGGRGVTAGAAGSGAASAGIGAMGGSAAAVCGNGEMEPGEDCDGAAAPSCEEVDYGPGVTRCDADCRLDTSDCERVERCADGRDNDDDDQVDCDDADCAEGCVSACSAPEPLADAERRLGSTVARAAGLELGCSASALGRAVVYSLTAEHTGVLEVEVESDTLLSVAIRSTCASLRAERACGLGSAATAVEAGETLFVVVQGLEAEDRGDFTVTAASRPANVCGDGSRDPAERCDDGNRVAGDGCDAECELEATEREPNDAAAAANAYAARFFAEISPVDDVDVVEVVVTLPRTTLAANVLNFGDGACAKDQMDSVLELFSSSGRKLGSDDDGGDGLCSRLVVSGLAPGSYHLAVRAAPLAEPATFPYRLAVSTDTCGNGVTGPSEECDDGNVVAGDGCSATCTEE